MSIPTPRWQRALLAVLVVVGLVVLYAGLYGCGDTEPPRYAPSSGPPTAVAPTPGPEPAPDPTPEPESTPESTPGPTPELPQLARPVPTPPPEPTTARPAPTRAAPAQVSEPASETAVATYRNCDAVRAAGAAPIRAGEPGYSSRLDRDGDGVACEPTS